MLSEQELKALETEKVKLIYYKEKSNEETFGPYTFEINTGIQTFYAHYYVLLKEETILLHLEEELNPVIAQKKIYQLLFKMRKLVEEKTGQNVYFEKKLVEKMEKILKYLEE